jgi:hypothetical protein
MNNSHGISFSVGEILGLNSMADMIAVAYGISRKDVLLKGREAPRVEARSLFCHIASRNLGVCVTDLARLPGMTPSAVTYAVRRGRKTAEEKDFKLE